jgi:hypothetical protein
MHFSADPDARWVTKGSKSTLGYKGFARIDEEGFVDKVHTTPANRAESPEFATMIDGASAPDTSDGPKPMPKWRWRPSDNTSSRPRTRSHSTRKTGLRPSRAEFIHRINSVTPFTPGNRINQANTLMAPLKRQQGESGRQIRAEAENQLVTQRSFRAQGEIKIGRHPFCWPLKKIRRAPYGGTPHGKRAVTWRRAYPSRAGANISPRSTPESCRDAPSAIGPVSIPV